MEKPSASNLHRKPTSGRRVRLIPATLHQEPSTPTSSSSSTKDSTQSTGTSSSDSHSWDPRGIMRIVGPTVEMPYPFTYQAAGIRNEEFPPSVPNSPESSSEAATQSDTKTCPTSSSSLRFSTDDEIEAEEREEGESKEKQGGEESLQIPAEAANRETQENPIREIHDLTGSDEEEAATSDD